MKGLSKSRIIAWKQCPKQLWLQAHQPSLIVQSEMTKRNFQVGNAVGEVARKVYPAGELIEHAYDLKAAMIATQNALSKKPSSPLFEAAFQHDGVLVRADVMLPERHGYRMIEVKSSTGLKDYHLNDCAIQSWIVRQNGIALTSVELAHIDTSFVYQGDGDYRGLFRHVVLDEQIEPLLGQVPKWVEGARTTLHGDEPAIEPGEQCTVPFECQFYAHCTRNMVRAAEPQFSLEVFYRMQVAKKAELRALGYEDALAVPETMLNEKQQWIQRVSRTGKAELKPAAQQALVALPYPRYYLDFETIALAVPRWVATRPFGTQVPFQWSCHIEDEPGKLRHAMFLDTSGGDPRRAFAESMIKILGADGPVIVYNQSFEKSRIKELAEHCVDLADDLLAINQRVVDLLPIAQENYYHPDMKGSWSIKAVLPTIAPGLAYDDLEVSNGGDAQMAYGELLDANTSNELRQKLIDGLLAYCERDTLAMVRIAWFFERGGNMDGVRFPVPEEKFLMTRSRAAIKVAGDAVTPDDMDRADKAALDASANNDGILIEKQRLYFELDKEKQTRHPPGMKSKTLASVWEIERVQELDVGNFTNIQVNTVAEWLKPYSENIGDLYRGSIQKQLRKLKDLVPSEVHCQIDNLIANNQSKTNLYSTMLGLRELMTTLMPVNVDENIALSEWIVSDWGGIKSGDKGKFKQLLKDAEEDHHIKIADNAIRTFRSKRIASWSKHLAFKYPSERAVYDAKVIYSLHWLLFKAYGAFPQDHQRVKYFPFLMGQNSAIGLLDYEIHLLFRDGEQNSISINEALRLDVEERRKGSRTNSRFVNKIKKDSQIFIEEEMAYSEYCNLLQRLAEELYPNDAEHRLTKTEMILFSIADAEIAKEVLQYISNLVTGKVDVAARTKFK